MLVVGSATQVEMLLKHGAYDVFREGEEGEDARKKFCEADIETILSRAVVCTTTCVLGTSHIRERDTCLLRVWYPMRVYVFCSVGQGICWTRKIDCSHI